MRVSCLQATGSECKVRVVARGKKEEKKETNKAFFHSSELVFRLSKHSRRRDSTFAGKERVKRDVREEREPIVE